MTDIKTNEATWCWALPPGCTCGWLPGSSESGAALVAKPLVCHVSSVTSCVADILTSFTNPQAASCPPSKVLYIEASGGPLQMITALSKTRLCGPGHFTDADIIWGRTFRAPSLHLVPQCKLAWLPTSQRRLSSKKVSASRKPQSPPRSSINITLSTSISRRTFNPLAKQLAARSSPTLLYQAASPVSYITGCYVMGGFCFAWAGVNFWNVIVSPPADLSLFVYGAMGGLCFLMCCFGAYCIYKVSQCRASDG